MKKNLLLILIPAQIFAGQLSFAQPNDCLSKFSWLTGSWSMLKNGSVTVEEWSQGNMALDCKSYEISGTDTTLIETATITCIAGKHVFTYHPVLKDLKDGRQPVSFALIAEENNTFVFENKEHDFPQRVVYQNVNGKECHAWIEGEENGKMNKVDFYYKRTR